MNDFEKQLLKLNKSESIEIDESQFLSNLHNKIDSSRKNKQSLSIAILLVFTMFISTFTQLGTPIDDEHYFAENIESNYFELDMWNIPDTAIVDYSNYVDDLAFYLLEEGDLWESVDLINELEYIDRSTL